MTVETTMAKLMVRGIVASLLGIGLMASSVAGADAPAHKGQRNIIIFVADGLRRGSVNSSDTPALYSVRVRGVDFANSHALFPTFTTPNASSIATGHYLGDSGDFSNTVYV